MSMVVEGCIYTYIYKSLIETLSAPKKKRVWREGGCVESKLTPRVTYRTPSAAIERAIDTMERLCLRPFYGATHEIFYGGRQPPMGCKIKM